MSNELTDEQKDRIKIAQLAFGEYSPFTIAQYLCLPVGDVWDYIVELKKEQL